MVGTLDVLPLSQIDDDRRFRLRPEGDVGGLAQSLARVGQLLPVEVRLRGPGRWQLVAGFRRVAALQLLKRDLVLARLHDSLSDEEALAIALADTVSPRPFAREELVALRERLQADGHYDPAAQEVLERALGEAPLPPEPEEQDLDIFSRETATELASLSADLASLYESWGDVEPGVREQICEQVRYFHDLLPFLEEVDAAEDDSGEAAPGDATRG
jgi:ParB family transcriptional regulator, chromosome partitioning protein